MNEYGLKFAKVMLFLAAGMIVFSQIPEAKKPVPETEQEKAERLKKGESAYTLLALHNYHCNKIPYVSEQGHDHYGRVQRVWCDENNSFRVTWRTYGRPAVTVVPWRD